MYNELKKDFERIRNGEEHIYPLRFIRKTFPDEFKDFLKEQYVQDFNKRPATKQKRSEYGKKYRAEQKAMRLQQLQNLQKLDSKIYNYLNRQT